MNDLASRLVSKRPQENEIKDGLRRVVGEGLWVASLTHCHEIVGAVDFWIHHSAPVNQRVRLRSKVKDFYGLSSVCLVIDNKHGHDTSMRIGIKAETVRIETGVVERIQRKFPRGLFLMG